MQTLTYVGIAEGDRDTGFSLFFPDLDGCITAADTLTDLAEMAREALQLHLRGMAESNLPAPPARSPEDIPQDPEAPEAGRLLITAHLGDQPSAAVIDLPTSLLNRLDSAAQARGVTRDAIVRESAEAFLRAG